MKTFLNSLDQLLSIIIKLSKISILFLIVYFAYNSIDKIQHLFIRKSKIPVTTIEVIKISVDENFHKNSKSLFQKFNEYFRDHEIQHIKSKVSNNEIYIIIDGQYEMHQRNILLKQELCTIYTNRHNTENDLNKKRSYEMLTDLYCF